MFERLAEPLRLVMSCQFGPTMRALQARSQVLSFGGKNTYFLIICFKHSGHNKILVKTKKNLGSLPPNAPS